MTPFKPWGAVPAVPDPACVVPFAPNWASPVIERLTWKTGMGMVMAGVEYRRSVNREPRQGIEFESLITGADVALLRNLLEGWSGNLFAVPLWYGSTPLLTTADTGAGVLNLADQCETLFSPGGWLIIWRGTRDFEVLPIESVGTDSINLAGATTAQWPAGSRVAPLQVMELRSQQSVEAVTSGVVRVNWSFEQVPGHVGTLERWAPETWGTTFPSSAPATDPRNHYLAFDHNWASGTSVEVSTDVGVLDTGIGVNSRRMRVLRPTPQWSLDVLLDTRADSAALRRFLSAHRGPAVSFWAPSPLGDLDLRADITGPTLTIGANGQHLVPPALRMGVNVTHSSGAVRMVASAFSDVSVTLQDTPEAVALDQVYRQQWVSRCRIAVEGLQIEHLTNRIARVRLPVMAVDVGSSIPGGG